MPPGHAERHYTGRFAPSPTGALHAGSLVAALASWLDARAHGGQWLVRIEDVDTPRCVPGADQHILQQLATCGLHPDAPPVWQSQRGAHYARALVQLVAQGLAYPCTCSRKAIATARQAAGLAKPRHGELIYPGTCRPPLPARPCAALPSGASPSPGCAWRLHTQAVPGHSPEVHWTDRRLGAQSQQVDTEVGDFVLKRTDGLWAYQLAVVADDAAQGITHVVRGQDLADNTARQILLQQALGLPTPQYLHTPLVLGADGQKLSKQNGAQPLDLADPLAALNHAAAALGLSACPANRPVAEALAGWARQWAAQIGA